MRTTPSLIVIFASTTLLSAIEPVPKEIAPQRVEGAKVRSVVFILSDEMVMQCPELFNGGTVVEEVVANIDIAPTVFEAMGLAKPPHMDGQSFMPLAQGRKIPWRDYFLYVYYWEKNFPQSPTVFSLRGSRYKYITYYGLWDVDELYDIQKDPSESKNLLYGTEYAEIATEMEKRLYEMMEEMGGMLVPLNPPRGRSQNKRLRGRGGAEAGNFPAPLVVEKPLNKNAR